MNRIVWQPWAALVLLFVLLWAAYFVGYIMGAAGIQPASLWWVS